MQDEPAPRSTVHADVLAAFAVVALVVASDLVRLARRPPGVELDAGLAIFFVVGLALGGLLAAATVALRRLLRTTLEPLAGTGSLLTGAIDLGALCALMVFAQDPRDVQGEARPLVLGGFLVAGAVGAWLLRGSLWRQRFVAAAAVVAASVVSLMLVWVSDPWMRLAGHLLWLSGGAFLLRPFVARFATPRVVAGLLALAVAVLAVADPLVRASPSARRALWGRSADVYAWLFVVGKVVDLDGDDALGWLGGADCDPTRASVHPGAPEVPGNGRDDDCRGGDAAARTRVAPPHPAAAPAGRPPDVLVLSIDSLRFDLAAELGAVGEALGPHAVLTRAVSPGAKTTSTLAAMVRGRPLREVRREPIAGVRGEVLWRDRSPTLGHALAARGYRAVTVPTDSYLDPRYGVGAGFEAVYAAAHDARGLGLTWSPFDRNRLRVDPALAVMLRAARETPGPFCGWLHVMDTHFPFYWGTDGKGPGTSAGLRRSIRYVDAALARFLRQLVDARGRRPLVAVLGDHGEELGEHGGSAHGSSVHAEQVRVGLLLAGPGVPLGRFEGPASVSSVVPTLLELTGTAIPTTMTEPSLAGPLRGTAPWPDVAVSEVSVSGRGWVGYTGPRYRLLVEPEHDLAELYDADRDPLEQHDLARSKQRELRAALRAAHAWDEAH